MELKPKYDNHKSFYGKAIISTMLDYSMAGKIPTASELTIYLYSYDTKVATYQNCYREGEELKDTFKIHNLQSSTTLRHVKEFAFQFVPAFYGRKKITKAELEKYYAEC